MLVGCQSSKAVSSFNETVSPGAGSVRVSPYRYTERDKECLSRAMFFESNRSSRDGMVAVGTVVMNRLRSGSHGNTICQVVGEKGQFAPGVMTRKMNSKAMPDVQAAAEAVLKGERSPKLKNAMFFHTAGLKFPYKNMHYVLVAGGNAFYEKRGRNWQPLPDENTTMVAAATPAPAPGGEAVQVASAAVPLPSAKGGRVTFAAQQPAPEAGQVLVADARQPDPSRFGADNTVVSAVPQSSSSLTSETAMAFQSTPDDTSSIGALIASESRPFAE